MASKQVEKCLTEEKNEELIFESGPPKRGRVAKAYEDCEFRTSKPVHMPIKNKANPPKKRTRIAEPTKLLSETEPSASKSKKYPKSRKPAQKWNLEEDKILVDFMFGLIQNIPWNDLAKELPNRDIKSMQNRWAYIRRAGFRVTPARDN
ncbi:2495_t:CDS:2, partial [Paraglomus occultum]